LLHLFCTHPVWFIHCHHYPVPSLQFPTQLRGLHTSWIWLVVLKPFADCALHIPLHTPCWILCITYFVVHTRFVTRLVTAHVVVANFVRYSHLRYYRGWLLTLFTFTYFHYTTRCLHTFVHLHLTRYLLALTVHIRLTSAITTHCGTIRYCRFTTHIVVTPYGLLPVIPFYFALLPITTLPSQYGIYVSSVPLPYHYQFVRLHTTLHTHTFPFPIIAVGSLPHSVYILPLHTHMHTLFLCLCPLWFVVLYSLQLDLFTLHCYYLPTLLGFTHCLQHYYYYYVIIPSFYVLICSFCYLLPVISFRSGVGCAPLHAFDVVRYVVATLVCSFFTHYSSTIYYIPTVCCTHTHALPCSHTHLHYTTHIFCIAVPFV